MGCQASARNEELPEKLPTAMTGGSSKNAKRISFNLENLPRLPGPAASQREFVKRSFLANAYVKRELDIHRVLKTDIDELVDAMHEFICEPGKVIFKAGDPSDEVLYVIFYGGCMIVNSLGDKVATVTAGGVLGEIAFFSGGNRICGAIVEHAWRQTVLFALSLKDYQRVVHRCRYVDHLHVLDGLSRAQKDALKDKIIPKAYNKGEVILLRQIPTAFSIVISGNIEIQANDVGAILSAGDYFGHEHLLRENNKEVMTIGALNNVHIAEIDGDTFFDQTVFGPVVKSLEQKLKRFDLPLSLPLSPAATTPKTATSSKKNCTTTADATKTLKIKTRSFFNRQYGDWVDGYDDDDDDFFNSSSPSHARCDHHVLSFCGILDLSYFSRL